MYKWDEKTYDTYREFFFYGIDQSGEEQLFDSFIYFSYMREIRDKYIPKEEIAYRQYKIEEILGKRPPTGEEILEETVRRAKKIALQYYRFIVLHNSREKFHCMGSKDEEKEKKVEEALEKRIREVVERKINDGSIQVQNKSVPVKNRQNEVIGKITVGSMDVSREWIRQYLHYPEGSIEQDKQEYIIRNWTEEVYDILAYLEKTEQTDKKGYYDLWISTGIKRREMENEGMTKRLEEIMGDREKNKQEIEQLQRKIQKNEGILSMMRPYANKIKALRMGENTNNRLIKAMDLGENPPIEQENGIEQ